MKTSENIYTAVVIVISLVLCIGVAALQFVTIPQVTEQSTVGALHFVCVVIALMAVSLGITAFINIAKTRLCVIPTVIQVLMLLFTTYGIPLAAWGGWLLYKSRMDALAQQTDDDL